MFSFLLWQVLWLWYLEEIRSLAVVFFKEI